MFVLNIKFYFLACPGNFLNNYMKGSIVLNLKLGVLESQRPRDKSDTYGLCNLNEFTETSKLIYYF